MSFEDPYKYCHVALHWVKLAVTLTIKFEDVSARSYRVCSFLYNVLRVLSLGIQVDENA